MIITMMMMREREREHYGCLDFLKGISLNVLHVTPMAYTHTCTHTHKQRILGLINLTNIWVRQT